MTKVREAAHTVAFVDEYCAHYRSVFTNVRHFDQFTQVELGLLAETKRKSLPRLAKTARAPYFDEHARDHLQRRLVHRLERLGFAVTLEALTTPS